MAVVLCSDIETTCWKLAAALGGQYYRNTKCFGMAYASIYAIPKPANEQLQEPLAAYSNVMSSLNRKTLLPSLAFLRALGIPKGKPTHLLATGTHQQFTKLLV